MMYSSVAHALIIHLPGKEMNIERIPNGLLYHDTRHYSNKNSEQVNDYSFVDTIDTNKNNYTRRQVQGADNEI